MPYRHAACPLHETLDRITHFYELYRMGLISWRTYIEEVGLTPEDFPDPVEPQTIWERLREDDPV